jgi:sulfate adenylyltransferase subunit 2
MTHLRTLEAESIHILREVASELQRPVMLYLIGKDSSVLLRLWQKAFYPERIPFQQPHVDTSYKFEKMIEFRDRYMRELGGELLVYRNETAVQDRVQPFKLGTQRCCSLLTS